jgi:hypothetical protein
MAGQIEMINQDLSMGHSPTDTVQSGGGGGAIEMFGTQIPLRESALSAAQKGGGASGIEMVGEQGLLSTTPSSLYGEKSPA